jgi:hypothetical protein
MYEAIANLSKKSDSSLLQSCECLFEKNSQFDAQRRRAILFGAGLHRSSRRIGARRFTICPVSARA